MKCSSQPHFKQIFVQFVQEYLELGYMTQITLPLNTPHFYSHQQGVLKESSSTPHSMQVAQVNSLIETLTTIGSSRKPAVAWVHTMHHPVSTSDFASEQERRDALRRPVTGFASLYSSSLRSASPTLDLDSTT